MLGLNFLVMALVTTICIFYAFDDYYQYYQIFFPILLTVIFFILFYSVC